VIEKGIPKEKEKNKFNNHTCHDFFIKDRDFIF
jgi:hypothetical protein